MSEAKHFAIAPTWVSSPSGSPLSISRAGPVDEGAGRLGPHGHVGQHEPQALQIGDRLAEGLALLHVARRVVDGALGDPHRLGADGRAAAVEGVHGDGEALALVPDPVLDGHPDLVEDDLARGAAAEAHLVLELGDLHAPVGLDHEAADPPVSGVGVGLGEDRVGVRDSGVGDPVLRPGQHVVVAVADRPAPHGGHIAAGVGLGQAVARLGLARGHPGYVLLRFRSSVPQLMIGSMPSLEMSMVTQVEAHTRASSSAMMAWVT